MDIAITIFPVIVVACAETKYALRASVVAGICFHFIVAAPAVEFERSMRRFFSAAGIFSGGGLVISSFFADQSPTTGLTRLVVSWSGFAGGLLLSLTIYRLFFHRCRSFPGPLVARLTRFYASYLNAREEQFYKKLKIIHTEYGDYARVGPRELSILDSAAIPIIYGPKTQCTKSAFYSSNGGHDDVVSINGIRDPVKHRPRRRAWDRGMSVKALTLYQPRIKTQADELVEQMRTRKGKPVDASLWSMFFAFDVMGDVGFSRDFGNVRTGKEHQGVRQMHDLIATIGVVTAIPWLPNLLNDLPGSRRGVAAFFDFCNSVLADKQKSFSIDEEPKDVVAWLLKAVIEKDASASPTPESLADDNRGVIIAGSDSTANTLANALFYLAKHQEVQKKLYMQLQASIPEGYSSWDYSKVKTLSYIDDIIHETLRLKPPIIQGMPRETPPQGIHIGDQYIPGHVVVSVPTLLVQRDPRWWEQPEYFIPERWDERREVMKTDDGPWIPFQIGMHACAGKSLAYMTLRIAISALVQNFEIRFAPGETGEKFDKDFLASFMMALRPLNLVFTLRSDI